jgi:3-oxoacyl-[acyl-carrier protein] reductase
MNLKGKTALITGGGTGLGRSIALQFAQEGVDLVINYSRSRDDAEKTAAEAHKFGVKAFAIQADVSISESAENLAVESEKVLGGLDILINNAGTTKFVPFKELDGLNEEDWMRLFKTNAMSIFFTSRAAAKIMKKQGAGHIINTVSIAGLRPSGSSIAYAVSKAAGIHATKCLALALAPEINVNGVAPGLLLTRWVSGFNAEQIEKMKTNALLSKTTDVDECASMYIAIAKNDSITGQIITVDCGQVI